MNKRKDVFDEIKEKYPDDTSKQMLHKAWEYYGMVDWEFSTHLADIFYDLYLVDYPLSYDELANKHHVSYITLYRYRMRFNDFAAKLLLLVAKAD